MRKLIYLFLGFLIVACSTDDNNNETQEEWLFVHTATEATATNSNTLVMPVTNDIFVFSDRPYRDYLYLNGEEYASLWDENEETDNFYTDSPNAVLTWVDGDGVEEVEVVITDADFDGDNIIYTIENSNLTVNQSFEDVSLFVDGIGKWPKYAPLTEENTPNF
ncbi:MAG: hypothetical protein P8P27_01380 [Flavobacteriaceae bacterium]|nr:hypothetical protein [Flavobacteriaceae bacterium]